MKRTTLYRASMEPLLNQFWQQLSKKMGTVEIHAFCPSVVPEGEVHMASWYRSMSIRPLFGDSNKIEV